jgi:hypothetical protein
MPPLTPLPLPSVSLSLTPTLPLPLPTLTLPGLPIARGAAPMGAVEGEQGTFAEILSGGLIA